MRQRVSQAGGTLTIESEPGGGTAVSASVPALDPAGVR
jgi:signal transduction histidine kinase